MGIPEQGSHFGGHLEQSHPYYVLENTPAEKMKEISNFINGFVKGAVGDELGNELD